MTRSMPKRRVVSLLAVILFGAGLFELACRVYVHLVVYPRFEATKAHWRNFHRASDAPKLAYELRPGTELMIQGRRLRINRFGIRADEDDLARGQRRLAILGDSIAFGFPGSQEDTLAALVQQELDPGGQRVRVLNFGLVGLEVAEVAEYLRVKDAIYDVDVAVYLLNLNDFTRRDSRYEGADDGLYRAYRRPRWVSLWMVRKLIYRLHRGPGWFDWLFRGNERYAQDEIERMRSYADASGIRFALVVLPVGSAYSKSSYRLRWIHDRIQAFLQSRGIRFLDLLAALGPEGHRYFDESDHLTENGNALVATLLAGFLRGLDPALATGPDASGGRGAIRESGLDRVGQHLGE